MVPLFNFLIGRLWILAFVLVPLVHSKTDARDVSALNVMYSSLNSPSTLDGWKSSGGDPCDDSWMGIQCSGSSVTVVLSDMGLTGSMGYQLASLSSVTHFDMSKNKLKNDIPYQLPPNAVYIDLSENGFSGGVPYSISQMKDLEYLNLGHNQLNGQLSDMFGKLSKLTDLDLSFNKLTGNLPQSFQNLSSLSTLNLQKNQFTGPINVLADLPLEELKHRLLLAIVDVVGEESKELYAIMPAGMLKTTNLPVWIPDELKSIKRIKTRGNSWSSGPAPPPPPGQKSKPHAHKSSKETEKSGLSGVAIAGIVMGILLALVIVISLFSRKSSPPPSHFFDEERVSQRRSFTPLASQELTNDSRFEMQQEFEGLKSLDSSSSFTSKGLQPSLSIAPKPPPSDYIKSSNDNEFANNGNFKRNSSVHITCYSLSDLQSATGNFASGRLLGEGTIGRVYRAKYADGKVFAVKKIDSSLFQGKPAEDFTEIVFNISKLHHPNIVELVGHCSEQGQNMLVYEYFRNGSLHEFLHLSDDFSKPLTWNTRVKIALGTARAVEYLHEVCSPSFVHKNIKSSNILLDVELNPHLSECGLDTFYQHTSPNLGSGCNAPECTKPSAYTMKSDVYSFGVVMLELLTGRMPFDSSKPRLEQSLVRWATPQLHDIDALGKMVDPALCGLYPPKSVSRFADIIALCIQLEPEFRPPMSEVVQALVRLVQRSSMREEFE